MQSFCSGGLKPSQKVKYIYPENKLRAINLILIQEFGDGFEAEGKFGNEIQ